MLKFLTYDDVMKAIEQDIIDHRLNTTPRNKNSISLRPLIYNCIREVYFEIYDCERKPPENLDFSKSYYWTGPIGSALHEKIQSLLQLEGQEYTEKLMTFESFGPDLYVRSKCDGIDLRDPNNIILYEFKTKDKMPNQPYHEELLQNLLSVFFFRRECNLNIKGSSMIYIDRQDPYNIEFFNYDFFDITSPIYLDASKELAPIFEKVTELLKSIRSNTPPSMESKYIKKFAYGKFKCTECPYKAICQKTGNWDINDRSKLKEEVEESTQK